MCCLNFSEIMSFDKKRWLKGKWSEGKILRYSSSLLFRNEKETLFFLTFL